MIINCFRCGKEIESANDKNADYVMAEDMIVSEIRTVLVALVDNETTLAKKEKEEKVLDSDYSRIEVLSLEAASEIKGLSHMIAEKAMKPIQKTGVICPNCYLPTDILIWGVHKEPILRRIGDLV